MRLRFCNHALICLSKQRNDIVGEGTKISDKVCATKFSRAPLLALCHVLEREGVVIDFIMRWCTNSEIFVSETYWQRQNKFVSACAT